MVQRELENYKEEATAETVVREVSAVETDAPVTVISDAGTVTVTYTAVSTVTSASTTLPETTEPEDETDEEETTEPEETEADDLYEETELQTDPEPDIKEPASGGDYNYGAPVPDSGQVKGSDYYDTCAFVGDSHTNGLGAYGFVDKSRVFAKDGLSISNIQQSISPDSISAVSPENVYIMMGTNGVAWLKSSDMIDSYESFAKEIESQIPGVNIYILSIPPVSYERSTTTDAKKNISMDKIRAYNSDLQDMAERHEWYFLDTFSVICGPSGYLEGSTDGIHMTMDLYRKFTNYILSHTAE